MTSFSSPVRCGSVCFAFCFRWSFGWWADVDDVFRIFVFALHFFHSQGTPSGQRQDILMVGDISVGQTSRHPMHGETSQYKSHRCGPEVTVVHCYYTRCITPSLTSSILELSAFLPISVYPKGLLLLLRLIHTVIWLWRTPLVFAVDFTQKSVVYPAAGFALSISTLSDFTAQRSFGLGFFVRSPFGCVLFLPKASVPFPLLVYLDFGILVTCLGMA